jgi:hypothetical protein
MHIEAGHVDSNWPEFTFVFTYISCLNRLALSAISLKTNSLSYLILFIISLVSIYKREKALNQLLTYKQEIHFESNYQQFLLTSIICFLQLRQLQCSDNRQSTETVQPAGSTAITSQADFNGATILHLLPPAAAAAQQISSIEEQTNSNGPN